MRNHHLTQAEVVYVDGRSEIIPCDSFRVRNDIWIFYEHERVVRQIPAGRLKQPPDGVLAHHPREDHDCPSASRA